MSTEQIGQMGLRLAVEHMYDGGVLADLATAIENLDIGSGGEELAQAIALRDRLDARIAEAAAAFDASGCWGVDGSTSMWPGCGPTRG